MILDMKYDNDIEYINWYEFKKFDYHKVTQDQLLEKLDELCQTRDFIVPTDEDNIRLRSNFMKGDTFTLYPSAKKNENYQNYYKICLKENGKYTIYSANFIDDDKNVEKKHNALQILEDKFTKRTGTTLLKAFGYTEELFKIFIPKQLYYFDNTLKGRKINKVSMVDFCSHYPSCMCGMLPDSHTMIEQEGVVKPSEDYPFAFYPETGHMAIYNELDTHDWLNDLKWLPYLFNPEGLRRLNNKETKTILMKAAKEELTEEWQYFYKLRKIDSGAKAVMNQAIGKMHKKDYTTKKLAHLVAVCIARANTKTLNLAKQIGNVLSICVDGLAYIGDKAYGVQEKGLNLLNQEIVGGQAIYLSSNAYIVKTDTELKLRHGSYNFKEVNGKLQPITAETCRGLDEIFTWKRDIKVIGLDKVIEELRKEGNKRIKGETLYVKLKENKDE